MSLECDIICYKDWLDVIDLHAFQSTSCLHCCRQHALGCPVNLAVWTLLSQDERSEEPPAENAVLDFEDMDKLHAHDLDKITAWMESMLASLCQLVNVRVNVPPCLCWMACADY